MRVVYDNGELDIHLSKEEVKKLSSAAALSIPPMLLASLPPEFKEQFGTIIEKIAKPLDDSFLCSKCTASFRTPSEREVHMATHRMTT